VSCPKMKVPGRSGGQLQAARSGYNRGIVTCMSDYRRGVWIIYGIY
jgi:hypothetical protein